MQNFQHVENVIKVYEGKNLVYEGSVETTDLFIMLNLRGAAGPTFSSVYWMPWVHFPREINLVTLPVIELVLAYTQWN